MRKRTFGFGVAALVSVVCVLLPRPAIPGEAAPKVEQKVLTRAELEADGITNIVVSGRRKGQRHDLFIIDLGGKVLKQLTDTPDMMELEPRWSPDGKWIAFTVSRAKEGQPPNYMSIWAEAHVMKPDGTGDRRIMEKTHNISWSPDSKQLAFGTGRDPDKAWLPRGFRILDLETGKVKWVAEHSPTILDVAWARDETFAYRIVGGAGGALPGGIYYQTSFAKRPVCVAGGCHPALARDGKALANNWTNPQLSVTANLDRYAETGDPKVLEKRSIVVPVQEACPVISEDGKYLLVQGSKNTTLRILRLSDFASFEIVADDGKLLLGEGLGGYQSDFMKPATSVQKKQLAGQLQEAQEKLKVIEEESNKARKQQ